MNLRVFLRPICNIATGCSNSIKRINCLLQLVEEDVAPDGCVGVRYPTFQLYSEGIGTISTSHSPNDERFYSQVPCVTGVVDDVSELLARKDAIDRDKRSLN